MGGNGGTVCVAFALLWSALVHRNGHVNDTSTDKGSAAVASFFRGAVLNCCLSVIYLSVEVR